MTAIEEVNSCFEKKVCQHSTFSGRQFMITLLNKRTNPYWFAAVFRISPNFFFKALWFVERKVWFKRNKPD